MLGLVLEFLLIRGVLLRIEGLCTWRERWDVLGLVAKRLL